MAGFLADENVPKLAVQAARDAGLDVAWMAELGSGSDDETVLGISRAEDRVLVTFDKDFGEMVFRRGAIASSGVILLRPRLRTEERLIRFTVNVMTQEIQWKGSFCVADEGKVRVVRLPP